MLMVLVKVDKRGKILKGRFTWVLQPLCWSSWDLYLNGYVPKMLCISIRYRTHCIISSAFIQALHERTVYSYRKVEKSVLI